MPDCIAQRDVIVVDPMLATGGSASGGHRSTCGGLGVKNIKLMVLVAAPVGIEAVLAADPDVQHLHLRHRRGPERRTPTSSPAWATPATASSARSRFAAVPPHGRTVRRCEAPMHPISPLFRLPSHAKARSAAKRGDLGHLERFSLTLRTTGEG